MFDKEYWEQAWKEDPHTSLKVMKQAGLGSYLSEGFSEWAKQFDAASFRSEGLARSNRILTWIENQTGAFAEVSVLDIGAASGMFSIPFSQKQAKVTALEPSPVLCEMLASRAEQYQADIAILNQTFEELNVEHIGAFDLVFASMCPAIVDWDMVKRALSIAKKYLYVSLMAGKKENSFVDEVIHVFNLKAAKRDTSDMGYLLNLLYLHGYTYQSLIERHHKTVDMAADQVLADLPAWLMDYDIPNDLDTIGRIEKYIRREYGAVVPVTTGGRFGKVLIHVQPSDS